MEDMKAISRTQRLYDQQEMLLSGRHLFSRRPSQFMKRAFDVVFASLLLLFLTPALLILWWMASRDGGKAIYGHSRVGQNGKIFTCYKFRTMVVNADERLIQLLATSEQAQLDWEDDFKLDQDPRVTADGKFLRSTSLDKLPQLWNVLRGEMSLVGPRPLMAVELERYNAHAGYYLAAKPGITGLWQAEGRQGKDYSTRAYYDALYVYSWTLWSDSRILLKAAGQLLSGKSH